MYPPSQSVASLVDMLLNLVDSTSHLTGKKLSSGAPLSLTTYDYVYGYITVAYYASTNRTYINSTKPHNLEDYICIYDYRRGIGNGITQPILLYHAATHN